MKIYNKHILVIDDDDRLRLLLRQFLEKKKFRVSDALNTSRAKKLLEVFSFDLIILDVMMPGESGLELLNNLRKKDETPVFLLTALDQLNDKIRGLKTGADDYLTKPFDPEELLLRIHNILKRVKSSENSEIIEKIEFGPFVWQESEKILSKNNQHIYLTNMETKLLSIFSQNIGKDLNRIEISKKLNPSLSNRSVDVGIARLRRKIELDPKQPKWLYTIRGKGWMLRATPLRTN